MTRTRIIRTRATQPVIRNFIADPTNTPLTLNRNVTFGAVIPDTRTGAVTITLPADPRNFQLWWINDVYWSYGTNEVVIDLNGKNWNGQTLADGVLRLTEPGTMQYLHFSTDTDSWYSNESWVAQGDSGTANTPTVNDTTTPTIVSAASTTAMQLTTANTMTVEIAYADNDQISVASLTPLVGTIADAVTGTTLSTITLTPNTGGLVNGNAVTVPYTVTLPGANTFADVYGGTTLSISAGATAAVADVTGNEIAPGTAIGTVPLDIRAELEISLTSDGATPKTITVNNFADARTTLWESDDGSVNLATNDLNSIVLPAGARVITARIPAAAIQLNARSINASSVTGLGNWPAVSVLDLSGNELTVFPAGMFSDTPNLTSLNVSFNNISGAVPSVLGQSTRLRTLNISSNPITSIPTEIGSLPALITLIANSTNLSVLPAEIASLPALRTLQATGNNFNDADIPSAIWGMSTLTTLSLSNNNLSAIPSQIGTATAITRLLLGSNNITTANIDPAIANLTSIAQLQLEGNALTSLPTEVRGLTSLTRIWLHNQQGMTDVVTNQFLADILAGQPWTATAEIKIDSLSPAPTGQGLLDKAALETGAPAHTVLTN